MRIQRFVVEGFRGIAAVDWRPGDLAVVTGEGGGDLFRAARLYAAGARGWSGLGDAMARERATEADFWHPAAVEVRWFVSLAPHEDSDLDFGHELVVERVDARPWWLVGYERVTLSSDFELVEVLERNGDRVEYSPPRRRAGGGITAPARSEVSRAACDMTTFSACAGLKRDPRASPHVDAVAAWCLIGPLDAGEGAPLRRPGAPLALDGALEEDGSNVINVLLATCDRWDSAARLRASMAAAAPGFDTFRFPDREGGDIGMEMVTRDGRAWPHPELPDEVLRAAALLGALHAPSPPRLLWLHDPEAGVHPCALPDLAGAAADAARRAQVVVTGASPRFADLLEAAGRRAGTTLRGAPLAVTRTAL